MEKLSFDTGIREYDVNGNGTPRGQTPSDPNVYERFFANAADEIQKIERELIAEASAPGADGTAQQDGAAAIRLAAEADRLCNRRSATPCSARKTTLTRCWAA